MLGVLVWKTLSPVCHFPKLAFGWRDQLCPTSYLQPTGQFSFTIWSNTKMLRGIKSFALIWDNSAGPNADPNRISLGLYCYLTAAQLLLLPGLAAFISPSYRCYWVHSPVNFNCAHLCLRLAFPRNLTGDTNHSRCSKNAKAYSAYYLQNVFLLVSPEHCNISRVRGPDFQHCLMALYQLTSYTTCHAHRFSGWNEQLLCNSVILSFCTVTYSSFFI